MISPLLPEGISQSILYRRVAAIFIDHLIMSVLGLGLPIYLSSQYSLSALTSTLLISIGIWCFLNKDIIGSRSLGKRAKNLITVSATTNRIAAPERLFIRNLTVLIWPLDLIVLLMSGRRIGDFLAKTVVCANDKPRERPLSKRNQLPWVLASIATAVLLAVLLVTVVDWPRGSISDVIDASN